MKILVAVDGSSYTKRMLAYLAAHDEWLGPQHQYTVIHAVPAIPPRAAAVLEKSIVTGHYADEAERVFKPVRTFLGRQKIPSTFLSKVGPAADVIATEARKGGHDLILMGSHGHGGLRSLVLGSVAAKVLAHTEVPVLLIR